MRFSDFVTLQRGFDLPKTEMREGPFPVLGSTSVIGHHSEFKVEPPGVVTGRSGSLGVVQFVDERYWPHNTALWVKDFKGNQPKFVYYCMQGLDFARFNAGAGVPTLNRNHLDSLEVNVPPLPIQRRIAGILSAYDELIENNQRRIKILEAMALATYREWFVNFRFPGHELSSQVSSPLGEIPQGWEVRRVAEFADFTKGFEPGSAAYKKQSGVGLVRFLRVGDLSKRNSGLFVDADLAKGRVLQPLDIAITLDGSVGEVKLGLSGAYSSGIRRVDIKDPQRLGWAFAYQLLLSDSIQAVIHAHAKGTTIKHAGTAVAALVYVSPTKDVIENYERIAAPLMRQVLVLQEQVENLRRTRDLLLPRLLSGELDVEASAA
jgi:type I restriction enzyme S subunit